MSEPTLPNILSIEVTPDDIRYGLPSNPTGCPIALACRRVLPSAVQVTRTGVEVLDGSYPMPRYRLPDVVVAWLDAFDARREVAPFACVLPRVRVFTVGNP